MKRLLMSIVLTATLTGQAFSMGHPHNVFAANKRMHAKLAAKPVKAGSIQASLTKTVVEHGSASLTLLIIKTVGKVVPTRID